MKDKISILNFAKEKIQYFFNPNEKFIKWIEEPLYTMLYDEVPEHSAAINFTLNNLITDSIEEIDFWTLQKFALDYLIYGGFALEVIKTRGGGYLLNYLDVAKCRISPDKNKIGYSENWETSRVSIKWKNITEDITKEGIYLFKNPKTKTDYPKPHYYSAFKSLDTLAAIAEYHNNNARTGFSPNVVINFNNGEPDETTKRYIEKGITDKFSGTSGQKFILSFNDSKDTAVTIDKLEDDNLDAKFESLQKFVQNQVMISHQITSPQLIGVKAENQGFSRTEYEESFEIFKTVVISGLKRELEYGLTKLFGKEITLNNKED